MNFELLNNILALKPQTLSMQYICRIVFANLAIFSDIASIVWIGMLKIRISYKYQLSAHFYSPSFDEVPSLQTNAKTCNTFTKPKQISSNKFKWN